MALTQITTGGLANGAVTTSKISNTVQLGGPTITQVQITDSSYNVLDDTAVNTTGGYIKITGTGFAAGAIVVIGSTNATSTAFVSSTVLNVQVPAQVAGTYTIYVVNSNGGTAIGVNGLTYSGTPTWVTSSTLPTGVTATPISIQLSATGDAPLTYALAAGNTLPTGLSLTSGGLLSGTVTVGVETVYAFTINAIDAQLQDSPRAFTITITVGDPYFYLTTMLLPGNGTNNGTNNTFLDSSSNNLAITRAGNTTQGTFTPFSLTGWSNYFNATTDKLTLTGPNLSGLANFTIELWVNFNSFGSDCKYVLGVTGGDYYQLVHDSAAGISFRVSPGYIKVVGESNNSGWSVNTWYHVALVKNGSTYTIYKNGTSIATNTYATTIPSTVINYIGGYDSTTGLNAYLSNLRITNTAVYTSNFTPSIIPLTAVAGTSLLTCQSNRFKDNSSNAFVLTVNGSTSVQSFSPFAPGAAYSTSTVGGSMYHDGAGDYLSVAASSQLALGTSDFCYETWYYPLARTTAYPRIAQSGLGGWTTSDNWALLDRHTDTSNSKFSWACYNLGVNSQLLTSTSTVVPNQWYHIAVTRSGSTFRMFINGVQEATYTNSGACTTSATVGFYLGGTNTGDADTKGYSSGARYIIGSAVYTSNFSVPTSPPTAIANTRLLCNFTNGQIIDSTSKNDLETVGDTKISTTQSKWGGSSIYFDGTGDYLSEPSTLNFAFLSNFTIECWIYLNSGPAESAGAYLTDFRGGSINNFTLGLIGSTGTKMYAFVNNGGVNLVGNAAVSNGTWHHLAYVRNGSTLTMYLNGTSCGSASTSYAQSSSPVIIGARYTGATEYINGYINDLRITNGYARYTANFTPPSSAFPTL